MVRSVHPIAVVRARSRWAVRHLRSAPDPAHWRRVRLRRRLRRELAGSDVSIISSNCIGGRISELAGNPYRSPTVGLLLSPDSYLAFVSDLARYLDHEITPDPAESARRQYPVGCMGEVRIGFQHYATFDDAVAHWHRRAARVDPDRVVLLWTDRGGVTDAHVDRFAALPCPRKLMLAAAPRSGLECVAVVPWSEGKPQVDELYTNWDQLAPVLRGPRLELFR